MRTIGGAAAIAHIGLTVSAMLAALGMLPGNAGVPVLTFLWWYAGFFAVVWTAGTLIRAATPSDERRASCRNDLGFPRMLDTARFLWRGLPVALLAGGHYGLAGLVAFALCLGIAGRVEDRRIRGEIEAVNPVSRAIHRAVFGLCGFAAPVTRPVQRLLAWKIGDMPLIGILFCILFFILFSPLIVPIYVFLIIPSAVYDFLRNRTRKARREQELVKAAHVEGKLAWFAYAEPH